MMELQAAADQEPGSAAPDPAQQGFPGGNPRDKWATVDLPLTIVFLLMYVGFAVTHNSIAKTNAKRGHKFPLSRLMVDFCAVRTITCIMRVVWIFVQVRGVVLAAQIFFNGGAAVLFAVNIILTQRIVRSMHPKIGWSKPFGVITQVMAFSVPVNIVIQIISIIIVFFSLEDQMRQEVFDVILKMGSSYNLILVIFPLWAISLACAVPGPKPEKFGVGKLRVKTSLVVLASVLLTAGALVRTYAFFNPRPAVNDDVIYGKAVFYITQFLSEVIVLAMYALFRFDLLFHVPNGSSGYGDYSKDTVADTEKAQGLTRQAIEDRIEACGLPHQVLTPSYSMGAIAGGVYQPVYVVFYPREPEPAVEQDTTSESEDSRWDEKDKTRENQDSQRNSAVTLRQRSHSEFYRRQAKVVQHSQSRTSSKWASWGEGRVLGSEATTEPETDIFWEKELFQSS